MAPPSEKTKAQISQILTGVEHITRHNQDPFKVKIENFIGYTHVPVGLAGPLHIRTPTGPDKEIWAPMATTEAAVVASCCRGCKVANASGGIEVHMEEEGMTRGPVFRFQNPGDALRFARALPTLQASFKEVAESTSKHARLQSLKPHTIGSSVHLLLSYACGDASGQNMVTIATDWIRDWVSKNLEKEYKVVDTFVEGMLSSDKKPSWRNVAVVRGVETVAWTALSDSACQRVLGCSSAQLYNFIQTTQEAGIRNGQHGSNMDSANILAAIFIATGQDPACVADASWAHLTPEYDQASKTITLSLYFPSMPVGVIGGGTSYATQQEGLRIMQCNEPGGKRRLAGYIAAFALALEISSASAVVTKTFARSHKRLARWEASERPRSKL
ncbi:hydroxymethylglutaryl-CoA reductase [Aspergillus luchuensis]|uniref:hydroxymethylglutaryl-CoA reductase (NADPH) n=1 Tax=Aspergillus kawachii TaxID=1069201 RepID=A0A146F4A3_ASPKA|nr:uncharacterized protein AKAW2_40374S [Aspergillus luchuensis]BCR98691.1 hypothetical protein AKAW2_40374S [Aspergillus luchuensis]BCS11017.1 hypothetical protein ALUC_40357S [Aspergillus luchuensis]GAA91598.1 hmg-CoA reductase [Aspergillus luchuensis IFO 4308]GAT20938.1 hmg-CoA reductase [Aspergillus luchuensis]